MAKVENTTGAEILKPGRKGLQCGRYCRSLRTLIHRGKYGRVANNFSATICSNEAYILCTIDCMVGKFLQHNLSLRLPTSQSAVILSSPDETTSPPSGEKPTDLMRALFVSVQSLWEVGDLGRKRDVGPGCAAGVVDHIGDPA